MYRFNCFAVLGETCLISIPTSEEIYGASMHIKDRWLAKYMMVLSLKKDFPLKPVVIGLLQYKSKMKEKLSECK